MEQSFPHLRGAIRVIPPGVHRVQFAGDSLRKAQARGSLGLPAQGTGLLLVGNDFRKKGLPTLLEALAQLPQDLWLAVVGSGEQDAAMRSRVHELSLGNRVFFLGALASVEAAYEAADCLVHPTLEDTYAMVVLEAMAHALPVVVSCASYCGISAELRDGVDALLLQDPRSAQEISGVLGQLVGNSAQCAALGAQARLFAAQRTWARVGAQHAQLYKEVAPRYRQRWLVLSHAFNMDGRAASQTITDKLPHLEAAGVELVILSGVSGRRDSRYEHYQLWPAAAAGIRFEARHVLRKHLGSGLRYRIAMLLVSLVLLPWMLLEKLLRPVESSWSSWLSAYVKARLLMRKRHFDWVYSTGGAFAAHVAGAALKRDAGVRWLAEVHDPMVVPGTVPATPQQKMQARVESSICQGADVAIWFTDQALLSAGQRNPELGARGHMMLPGVDAPPFELEPYKRGDKFVIGHFGSLSPTRNLASSIAALDLLIDQQPGMAGRVELHVYGGPLDPVSAAAVAKAKHGTVRHFGRIENDPATGKSGREQILQRMRSADVLLLLHGTEPICAEYIPSKMYEYLWMQRPILALVHSNAQMQQLLEALGHSCIATSANTFPQAVEAALATAMEHLLHRWFAGGGLPDVSAGSPYTTQASVSSLLTWAQFGDVQ